MSIGNGDSQKQRQREENMTDNEEEHVLNQNDIEKMANKRSGIPKDTIKTSFNAMWDAICEALEHGYEVKLHAKGSFYLSRRSPRIGRNPLTGEEHEVPEREAMAFRTSPAYARRLRKRRKEIVEQNQNNNE